MKSYRFIQLAIVFILIIAACTTPPEPTGTSSPPSATAPQAVPPSSTSSPTASLDSEVTSPQLVSTRTPLPPTPVPALSPLPGDVGSNICPGTLPSMLMPGRQGRVSNATPDSNRVRAEPNAQAELVGEIPAGAYFDVLEGPTCADGAWFRVKYEAIEGWMKEGSSSAYWVMPILADPRTVGGPTIEAGGLTLNLPAELGATVQVQDIPFNSEENIPPVTLIRLPDYQYFDGSPSIYIYPVQDYLYYRADLRTRLENVRSTINRQLADPAAQISLPEFRDPFVADQTALLQVGRFNNGFGLHAVSLLEGEPDSPYYIFLGFSADMAYLIYVRLPLRLAFGQMSTNASPYDFSPSIDQIDTTLQFRPLTTLAALTDPSSAGACPGAPPFTLMLGDWARVSVDPPQSSRIRSNPGSGGEVLGEAQPGDNLLVIDGPQCASGLTWWKVRSLDGLEGWAAEGDADAYWLVEPISAWYQLPPPLASGNLVSYSLREINISAPSALIDDFSAEFFPLATPMPTPATIQTPWPEDPRSSIYTSAGHSTHSTYRIVSHVLTSSSIRVYDLQDPLSQYYVNNLVYGGCTDMLRDNLQNDPLVESYIISFCGIGGGIPVDFIVDAQPIQFTGGRGLRFLLSSGNYLTTNELNYIFQGLSDDGRYYIVALLRDITHPYIVDSNLLMEGDFGPLLGWRDGQYDEAETSYAVFNERTETLLDAQVVTLYPQLQLLDAMMASIVIK
jgi:hypothetical protein